MEEQYIVMWSEVQPWQSNVESSRAKQSHPWQSNVESRRRSTAMVEGSRVKSSELEAWQKVVELYTIQGEEEHWQSNVESSTCAVKQNYGIRQQNEVELWQSNVDPSQSEWQKAVQSEVEPLKCNVQTSSRVMQSHGRMQQREVQSEVEPWQSNGESSRVKMSHGTIMQSEVESSRAMVV